ncbi:MAG: ATP-binding protein [Candidatus Avoscillospira sp.]
MKRKKKKKGLYISVYFTVVIMAVVVATLLVSAGVTLLLDWLFAIHVSFPTPALLLLFSLLLGCTLSVVVSRKFLSPITTLSRAMNRVAEGAFDTRLENKSSIREIRDIYENFNLMVRDLGATEILQTDFVSNVSHEFKTPINAIEGYAMLLQGSQQSPEEQGEYVEKILLNTRRLSELVGNILLLSRIDNQSIQTNRTVFRLDEQIRQAILLLEPKWAGKDILFEVDLDALQYYGNESMLLHIWTNLIGNAVKFDPMGGWVHMSLKRQGDQIVFTIEDNGCGIAPKDRGHIFDKFFQGDNSRREEGNGLGLALVKRILDSVGGTVTVESEGVGSRFTVWLPISESQQELRFS